VGGNTVNNWQDDFITAGYPGSPYPNFDNPVGSGIIWPSVRWYNETNPGPLVNDGLVGATSNLQPLAAGQGFAAWSGSGFTTTTAFVVDVTGAPTVAAAPVALPMSWTNTGVPAADGWNLVSNPLPSPIAFDQIARGANVEDYVTYFNPINGNTAVYDISLGGGTNQGTNTIQSSQGFWLKTNGPAVTTTVEEADKIASNTGGLFGGDEESILQALRLKVSSALNAYTDETLVVFNAGEPELEGEDVPKYVFAHPEAPQIATKADGGEWIAINAYGSYDMAATIPVIVDVAVTGNYTITASGLENLGLTCLVLEDESTGVYTPLLEGSTYTFTMNAAANANAPRFFLHASVPVELEVSDATCATTGNGSAVVEFQGAGTTEATWTNAAGDVLQQGPLENGFSVLEGLGAGAYNVSVTSDAGCGNLQQSFTIEAPWAMEATAQTAPASCANTADGSVSVEVLGGVAPYSYLWSNAATTATLTAGAGTYIVEVTDANGCLFTPPAYTIVHNGPVAGFTAAGSVLVNEALAFTNTSTPGAEYLWDFGDGESSEEVSPEHVWTTPGTYTVTLTVTSGSCTTTASQTITVETTTVIATATPITDLHAWLANEQFIIDHPFNNGLPVVVEVLDAAGHLVRRHQAPGYPGRILLPADGLASGIWLLRISNAEEQHILRIPVLR
jgi:hypothetical protein